MKVITWDLETGGFSPKKEDIVEVGMICSEGFEVYHEGGCLVKPTKPIPEGAVRVHGITTEEATNKGFPWESVGPRFADRLHQADAWCGFNLDFDIRFARHHLSKIGIELQDRPVIDVFKLAQNYIPSDVLRRKNLSKVSSFLGVQLTEAHRAVNDSMATLKSLELLLNRINLTIEDVIKNKKIIPKDNYGQDLFESYFKGMVNGKGM